MSRFRHTRLGSAGMTMAELIIAMMVLGLLMVMTVGLYSSIVTGTASVRASDTGTKTASNAMRQVTQVVRNAVRDPMASPFSDASPFVTAGARSMTIYTVTGADAVAMEPRKVAFSVNGAGEFVEQTWTAVRKNGTWEWPSSSRSRVLGSPFTRDALFTYRDRDNEALSIGVSGATETQRLEIASVSITLTVDNGDTAPSLSSTVKMPNLGVRKVEP